MSRLCVIACFSALSCLSSGKRMAKLEVEESLRPMLANCPKDKASMTKAIENMGLGCIYGSKYDELPMDPYMYLYESAHMEKILSEAMCKDSPEVRKLIMTSLFGMVLTTLIDPHSESKYMTRGVMEEVIEAECNLADGFFDGTGVQVAQEVMGQLFNQMKDILEVVGEDKPAYFSERNSFPKHITDMLRHFIKHYAKEMLDAFGGLPQPNKGKKADLQAAVSTVEMTTNRIEQKWATIPELAAADMPPEIVRTRRFQREIRDQVRNAWNGLAHSSPTRLLPGSWVPDVPASESRKKDIDLSSSIALSA